jgi:hypothetical protein
MQTSLVKLTKMKQEAKEPTISFAERFLTQVEATESLWGPLMPTIDRMDIAPFEVLEGEEEAAKYKRMEQWIKETQEQLTSQAEKDGKARDKFLACLFLACADRERYKEVVDDLGNDFSLGNINYPDDVSGMLNLLINRRGLKNTRAKQLEDVQDGVMTSFQQNNHPKMKCNYCGRKGHMTDTCHKRQKDEERCSNDSGRSSRSNNSSQGWFSGNPRSGMSSFQYMERSAWDQEY